MNFAVLALPILGALGDAIYLTIVKAFFRQFGRVSSREFTWLTFAAIIIVLLVLFPVLGTWPSWFQIQTVLWPLIGVAIIATTHNLLFAWGMQHENLSEVQPFLLFNPLMAILVASIFYPDQRVWQIFVASGIAALVLILTHMRRHHFVWSRGLAAILGYILLYGIEVVLLRQLLVVFPPLILYLVRCTLVFIALTIVAPPRLSDIKTYYLPHFWFMGSLAVLSTWAVYTSFQLRGIAHTLFIFVLSPVLVYWFSAVFLHEKWRWRNILASILIVGLVVWISTVQ